jgi:hypothetical protein
MSISKLPHLDLSAIGLTLAKVQRDFPSLSERLAEHRDPPSDEVCRNMLAGYALVDEYVSSGIDLFDLQHLGLMLEINATVLCGTDPSRRVEYAEHLAATETHFYQHGEGGIGDLFEWYAGHRDESVWKRAAGVYVRILSKPQLFIEGNHRSGSLIVSYLMLREALPPFVLSVDNAEAFFNPSSVIRNAAKHGVKALFELPKIKKKYAAFLEVEAARVDGRYFQLEDAA